MIDCDVIVVGGGPAGLAFARLLNGAGLDIVVVERQPEAMLAEPAEDGREIALTHRSVATLDRAGAWDRLPPCERAPLRAAEVRNGGLPLALAFDAAGAADDRLGWLVPNHRIRRALYESLAGQPGLTMLAGTGMAGIATDGAVARATLSDGRQLAARLFIAADSRFSQLRDQLGIAAQINRLGRSMLCCRVAHTADHGGIAREIFGYGQTVALLPLDGRTSSVVLTLDAPDIARIAALPVDALSEELTRRSDRRLGTLAPIGAAHVYPLATSWARHFVAPRAALVGDAAVGMHPVTAHGFNLGLRGAATLAALVTDAAARGDDIGAEPLLRRYERAHRLASRPVYEATNAIVKLYTDDRPAARIARNAGLLAARLPIVRRNVSRALMRH